MSQLIVGADPFPPYQYIDKAGRIQGSDFETVKSVIDKMSYEATYLIKEWAIIDEMFHNKSIDIVFQVQKTVERERHHYFSRKLRDARTSIVTAKGHANVNHINDLLSSSEKLAVIKNYQYGEPIDSISHEIKVFFDSTEALLQAVHEQKVDYGVVDIGVFDYLNKDKKYPFLSLIPSLTFARPLYVAFNDELLRNEFDSIIAEK